MSEKAVYEAFGIRPDGSSFTVEILGYQTLVEAASLARNFAGQWQSTVHLYRVPFLNTGSAAWAPDEIEFVNKFTCEPDPLGQGRAKEPIRLDHSPHRLSSPWTVIGSPACTVGRSYAQIILVQILRESARGWPSRMARSGSGAPYAAASGA